MILTNSINLLTCKGAYAIEGLHSGLTIIDLYRKKKEELCFNFVIERQI
jgi:hypothetical protein